jgi:hypothetical protein
MRRLGQCARRGSNTFALSLLTVLMLVPASSTLANPFAEPASRDKSKHPALRWDESNPGCTFSRSDDGHLHYGLWSGDIGITLTIDSQELEKVHRRHEPFFAAMLEVRYRGAGALDFATENISLEFEKHFQVVQTALDLDSFLQKIQNDADAVDHQTAREVEKHPERKEAKEAYAGAFQKETSELQEFVSKNGLRAAHLDAGNPEARGWVFFSVNSEWIDKWKKREEFILRVPIDGKVFEFPFALPPKPGEVMLRKRP